jgi:hypothetical protein
MFIFNIKEILSVICNAGINCYVIFEFLISGIYFCSIKFS